MTLPPAIVVNHAASLKVIGDAAGVLLACNCRWCRTWHALNTPRDGIRRIPVPRPAR